MSSPTSSGATASAQELLVPQEVADIFRVEVETLAKWRWKKIGPPHIKIGRMVRYPRAGVIAILEGGEIPS